MSAIRCKIILCMSKAVTASDLPAVVIDELEKNKELADDVVHVQEVYVQEMRGLMKKLTDE